MKIMNRSFTNWYPKSIRLGWMKLYTHARKLSELLYTCSKVLIRVILEQTCRC